MIRYHLILYSDMIKDISCIKAKSVSFIKEFINNCTVEEKIDTHYVIVEITSKQTVTIKKANGKVIDRVDMILNNMWSQLVTDWNFIRLTNQEWFAAHVGYCISMFYFPCKKPLLTEYKDNIRYLVDRIIYNDEPQNIEQFVNGIRLKDKFNISIKKSLTKNINYEVLSSITGSNKESIDYFTLFNNMVNKDNVIAVDKSEGYIFKWNKNLYQLLYNDREKINTEKSQYEFLLCDFVNYCKNSNYQDKIQQSYVRTVCSLFNDYIVNWEGKSHNIEKNIDIKGIQAPSLGVNFDMGYEYIPDIITLNLCKSNELYKSIFKVLLANLKRGKDYSKCIYMSKKHVDNWNIITKNIKVRTLVI